MFFLEYLFYMCLSSFLKKKYKEKKSEEKYLRKCEKLQVRNSVDDFIHT